jgi:two-component sensor histidine kinase
MGQPGVSFSKRLNRIDSIVNSSNTYNALKEVIPLYQEFILVDSISKEFKKLGRGYVFILEKSELNESAIEVANSLLNRRFEDAKFNAEILILLARTHEKLGNGKLCKERLQDAFPLVYKVNSDSLTMIWSIRNSSYHRIYGSPDTAIVYAQQAFDIAKEINQPLHQATASFLLAFLSEDWDYKIERITYSKNIYKQNKDISGTAAMCMALKNLYLKKGDSARAQFYLDTVGTFVVNTPYLGTKLWYYQTLKDNFRGKGMLDSALKYDDSTAVLTIQLQQKQDRIRLLTTDLVFVNKRLEADVANKKLIILKEQLENKLISAFLATTLILTIVILLLSFDQYKKRKIIEHQKSVMTTRNSELNDALQTNKVLLKELNHRVKNNLSALSSLLEIQARKSPNALVKEELNKSIDRISIMSHVFSRTHQYENSNKIQLKHTLVEQVRDLLTINDLPENAIQLKVEEIELQPKELTALSIIVNELVTNAIKHGEQSKTPFAYLTIKKNEDSVLLSMESMGVGLTPNYNITDGQTSGLFIVNILTKQLGGILKWEQNDNSFRVYFNFNLK